VGEPIRLILCDIEGTTTSLSFVHDVLFPFSRERLRAWVGARAGEPRVQEALLEAKRRVHDEEQLRTRGAPSRETPAEVPDGEAVETLLRWIDEDRKEPALKRLQGWIWEEGYRDGTLRSHVYDDVPPALARWRAAGVALGVYSSGSVEAQRLLFAHAPAGDLTPLFAHWFDTAVGAKREPASYAEIARRTGVAPAATLFLSDVEAELDAARAAGMRTTQLVRPGTAAGTRHETARDFTEVRP
jgi:enolase-phosphatase E1